MYLLKKFHVFSKQYLLKTAIFIFQSSYMYLSKMSHTFVKVVTYICQSPSMFFIKLYNHKSKLRSVEEQKSKEKVIV